MLSYLYLLFYKYEFQCGDREEQEKGGSGGGKTGLNQKSWIEYFLTFSCENVMCVCGEVLI